MHKFGKNTRTFYFLISEVAELLLKIEYFLEMIKLNFLYVDQFTCSLLKTTEHFCFLPITL